MNSVMKVLAPLVLAFAALLAQAQPKPGDFEVSPLPPQVRSMMRTRAVGTRASSVVRQCSTDICTTTQPHACIEVGFPETSWRTCISNQGRRGLVLGPTDLRRDPTAPWMRILREASVAEIFVPYHFFSALRLYDFQSGTESSLLEMSTADAGPTGTLVTLAGGPYPQVAVETNDRGIAWLCKGLVQQRVRRGQEVVLWGVYDAQNYDFIIDYRLRDDGSIGFHLGATGFNNPYIPPDSTTDAHMHSILWRVDVDLNGADGDSAMLLTHNEPSINATDSEVPFNGGKEGAIAWDALQFLTIAIEDTTPNVFGHPIGYAIHTTPEGISRHKAGSETFTQTDFAVTRYKQGERDAFFDTAQVRWLHPDQYLLGEAPFAGFGISDAESVTNEDLVLWHRTSVHHDPHDEDHAPGDPANLMTGVTLVHWTGFDLEPRNLFDFNPLGGPSRANCTP